MKGVRTLSPNGLYVGAHHHGLVAACSLCCPSRLTIPHNTQPSMASEGFNVASKEAKSDYFLTPDDLRHLPVYKDGGFGCGVSHFYRASDLRRASLAKHGQVSGESL
jgi:hypothetical protein